MPITIKQLTDPADDDTNGLEIAPVFFGSATAFYEVPWAKGRGSSGDVSFFRVVQIIGGSAVVRGVGGGDALILSIQEGDYVAYGSYVVWHIPAEDWDALGAVIDGQMSSVNVNPPVD